MVIPVTLVVLANNRREEIARNVALILSAMQHQHEFEVIVVDNGSTDGTKELLYEMQEWHPALKIVLNEENLGVAGGRNSGFELASRDYIVALDDDSRIDIESLRQIPAIFDVHEDWGVLAFKVVHAATGAQQTIHGDTPCEVANHHGAGFAFRRKLYQELGGIDPECNFGAEEFDFAIRVHNAGFKVQYIPTIVVYHNNKIRSRDVDQYRRVRRVYNNVRIYYKYFPEWMARRNGTRYLIAAAYSWVTSHGVSSMPKLISAYQSGRKAGKAARTPVSTETWTFYNDPTLNPTFGNVPLTRKLFRLFKSR